MKLKVQQVFDATLLISQIIREARPMPQKGKYRLARMHAKLLPEFDTINAQRDEMIKAYGYHPLVQTGVEDADVMAESPNFAVPNDKLAEFNEAWRKVADEDIEVDMQPVPLAQLDLGPGTNGVIEAHELAILGDLVEE